jgi:16S rRNA (guanine1207-N2)-methyltransferase
LGRAHRKAAPVSAFQIRRSDLNAEAAEMIANALKTLFHPFEAGMVSMPPAGERVLFLGAEPGFRLPDGFDCELSLVQGFRPDFLALQREGHRLGPEPDGDGYAVALVLCNRHRGHNELNIAEALARVGDGGLIVIAGGKEDGVASLAKRMDRLVALDGQAPKYHGLVFWLHAAADRLTVAGELRAMNAPIRIDGRFETSPGMFSHGRIDPGSRLLAEALPADLSGKVADLCAGWGYLSAELIDRCARVTSVDLYEADHASLEAARRNLAGARVETGFFWRDLATEPVDARYDAIVMNPPFHQGRAAEPGIGSKLIAVAAKALKSRGKLFLVANKGLPYERDLGALFSEHRQIAADDAFKVFAARK